MENNELQKIWKTVDADIKQKSRDELNLLLTSKARQVFTQFLILDIVAIPVCIGLMIWLIVTSVNRIDDVPYIVNNFLLGVIALFTVIYIFMEMHRYKRNRMDRPVKEWLEIEINRLSKWFSGKYRIFSFSIIPVLYILAFLSIHVYYSDLYFTEVFRSDKFLNEDLWGVIIFTPLIFVGLYFALNKLHKYQMEKLQFLKDLYQRLCKMA
jgi:hypothetical protein